MAPELSRQGKAGHWLEAERALVSPSRPSRVGIQGQHVARQGKGVLLERATSSAQTAAGAVPDLLLALHVLEPGRGSGT